MPYLIVYRPDKNWLVVIEAVTGHGPVDPKRRAQVGVADLEHGQVVPERRLQGGLAKAEAPQPPVMGDGPLVASSPHLTVAEQELGQSVSGPGAVGDGVVPRPAKIPHRLLLRPRDPDRGELSRPVQPSQPSGVATVGLDPVPRSLRDQRRCDDLAAHPERGEQAVELIAGGTGLVAGTEVPRLGESTDQPAHGGLVVED